MAVDRKTTIHSRANPREMPYRGWAWRGAELSPGRLAHFTPGRIVKHLGTAVLASECAAGWPIQFLVFVHRGWKNRSGTVLPANACFEVRAILPIPGGGVCVAMEQVEEGSPPLRVFQRRLRRWLDRALETRSAAEVERRGDWQEPFAQWLPQSRPGDSPVEAVCYDFEEAVRFASAWTGVDEGLVWRILEAHGRYLELAGIAVVEEDAALRREREAIRGWLPGTPGVVGQGAEEYVAWATGISREVAAAVDRGEMAYLDHLGLIEWACEGERDECLGIPDWVRQGREKAARRPGRKASENDGPAAV